MDEHKTESEQQSSDGDTIEVRRVGQTDVAHEELLEAPDVEDFLPEHASTSTSKTDADENAPGDEEAATLAPVEHESTHTFSAATQPAPQPVAAPPASAVDAEAKSSGGVIVLQWLAYAFWFWFVVSLTWLAGVVINFAVVRHAESVDWSSSLAYPMASTIILLIIAGVTDIFYAKHEPAKKTGAAYIIMLLHVVPFVLIAIGALVAIVFTIITMLLNSDPVGGIDGPLQVMWVATVGAVLTSLLAVRAFFGGKRPVLRKVVWGVYGLAALGFMIAAIAGPAVQAASTKQDRLIESALPALAGDVRDYALKNDKLPASLSDVTHEQSYSAEAVQKMIDQKLVTYKPNTLPAEDGNTYTPGDNNPGTPVPMTEKSTGVSIGKDVNPGAKKFYYQLCVNYTAEKKAQYNYDNYDTNPNSYTAGTSSGVAANYRYDYISSIGAHPKGDICYNLYADGKYNYSY